MAGKRRIVILGSSGSIGTQTLDVVRKHANELEVVGLAVGSNVDMLGRQAREFSVSHLVVGNENLRESANETLHSFATLATKLPASIDIDFGASALERMSQLPEADVVVNALSGALGMRASVAALEAGKVLALANKESLVVAGDIIMPLARREDERRCAEGLAPDSGPAGSLVPIDSEHGAIFQCLLGEDKHEVSKLWVTASGGPFRGKTTRELAHITPAQALKHPTWHMGAKISIDSSTLMNKGLEVIEAHHLFDMPYEKIEVVVQPQSAIHSMVEFSDGSVKAHLGTTDMRIPIQFALSYPFRWSAPVRLLDFRTLGTLEFESPDESTFRCLALARQAGNVGKTLPCVMNAANEIAVAEFLNERCSFLGIAQCVEACMEAHLSSAAGGLQLVESLDQLQEIDAWARMAAKAWIAKNES